MYFVLFLWKLGDSDLNLCNLRNSTRDVKSYIVGLLRFLKKVMCMKIALLGTFCVSDP